MTVKRDLKRRVRERQARTGESYMTARRHIQGQRPNPVQVVELVDMTEVGAALGLKCSISMVQELCQHVDPPKVLQHLRDVLLATEDDPGLAILRAVVLQGERPRVPITSATINETVRVHARARAGIGGVSESGHVLALNVDGKDGATMAMFLLNWSTRLIVSTPDVGDPMLVGFVERRR